MAPADPAMSHSDALGDSEAGPDIAERLDGLMMSTTSSMSHPDDQEEEEEEFRPAAEVFRDPNALDFLSQHGTASGVPSQLARESLYVKFDPLVGGRPSMLPGGGDGGAGLRGGPGLKGMAEEEEGDGEEEQPRASSSSAREDSQEKEEEVDLMALQSPSPKKPPVPPKPDLRDDDQPSNKSPESTKSSAPTLPSSGNNRSSNNNNNTQSQQEFQQQLLKKESQIADLDRQVEGKLQAVDRLRQEVRQRRDSEEQMRQVLKEYEKTISELIAEKEKEKGRHEEERELLRRERDQAADDLRNVEAAFADVHRKYERTKQVVEGFKHNEETLKQAVQEQQARMRRQEQVRRKHVVLLIVQCSALIREVQLRMFLPLVFGMASGLCSNISGAVGSSLKIISSLRSCIVPKKNLSFLSLSEIRAAEAAR